MKILDRYIFKKFMSTFLFALVLMTTVIVLVDFTEKNEDFIYHQLGADEILDYYSAFVLVLINLITPTTVFISTVFVTSRLAQHTELVAALSGGINLPRLLVPYMAGACIITAGNFYMTGWGLAHATKKCIAFEEEYIIGTQHSPSQHLHIKIGPTQYLYVERYKTYSHLGINASIDTIEGDQLLEKLSAATITWHEEEKVWKLHNWARKTMHEEGIDIERGSTLMLNLDLHPDDFSMNPKLHETLTLPELDVYIKALKAKGIGRLPVFITEKYVRYMTPFSAFILTFLGVVVAARKSREGVGPQLAIGFVLAAIYISMFLFAKGIAQAKGTQLLLTIWTPNLLFACVGGFLYKRLPQ